MSDILDRVEQMLSEKNWSWAQFARELNSSDQRVYNWRKRGVPKSEAARIAKVLGCSADWLLTGEGPRERFDLLLEIRRQRAKMHRKPGDEHLSDEEVIERAQQEEMLRLDKEGLAYEDLSHLEFELEEIAAQRESPNEMPNIDELLDSEVPRAEDELEFIGHMDAWDSNTPLDEDEVELPLYREVELAAGAGATQVIENHGAKLRFAKSTLRRAGVSAESAACAFVRGNSMEPVMPDGTCVGVNTADKTIKDGEIYAIDHGGMLRVKYLHRRPGGGIKIVSQNAGEHPIEELNADEMAANVRVIGRVFWWSVLR